MKRKVNKATSAAMVLLLASSTMLAACSGGKEGNADQAGTAASGSAAGGSKEPVKISTMQPYWGVLPKKGDPLFTEVEKIMNADIKPTFVQGPNMMDKVNVALASGTLPDILVVFQGNQPSIIQAIRAGAFWEVGKYIDEYPNLKASRDKIRDTNISVDGKIWALYDPQTIDRSGINLRQDWLDTLGMKRPKTLDELYEVLKAFAKNDPDGNGKNDTYGIASIGTGPVGFIAAKYGAPNGYKVENGKFIPGFTTEEYRQAMKYVQRLYNEGIMNKDFSYAKQNQTDEMLEKGVVGAYIGNADRTDIWTKLFKNVPKAKVTTFSDLEGPNYRYASLGYWSTLMFPKSSIKTEERLKEILAALDRLAAPDHKDFRLYGIEGTDYKLENGKRTVVNNEASAELEALNVFALTQPEISTEDKPDWQVEMANVVQANGESSTLLGNPASGLISQTNNEKGNELNTLISDATTKYIIGELDDKGFDAVIQKWRTTGGDQMLKEYEEEYAKLHK
ncbi:extracellular solute-binding protein [Paenibacillus sp. SAF-054]|uniref:extracellular solute-binding protein n=1 Tax=unclassified Paenibacillus TaxID=185978 RepID=UPI003F80857A